MPDSYEDHENAPATRAGMEHVVRSADARDASGNRLGRARPQVGEADASTRHRALEEAERASPAPKAAPAGPSPAESDPSGVGGRTREQTTMDAVDKAVGG